MDRHKVDDEDSSVPTRDALAALDTGLHSHDKHLSAAVGARAARAEIETANCPKIDGTTRWSALPTRFRSDDRRRRGVDTDSGRRHRSPVRAAHSLHPFLATASEQVRMQRLEKHANTEVAPVRLQQPGPDTRPQALPPVRWVPVVPLQGPRGVGHGPPDGRYSELRRRGGFRPHFSECGGSRSQPRATVRTCTPHIQRRARRHRQKMTHNYKPTLKITDTAPSSDVNMHSRSPTPLPAAT